MVAVGIGIVGENSVQSVPGECGARNDAIVIRSSDRRIGLWIDRNGDYCVVAEPTGQRDAISKADGGGGIRDRSERQGAIAAQRELGRSRRCADQGNGWRHSGWQLIV